MKHTQSRIALALLSLVAAQVAHASKVEWSVSVGAPIQVSAPAPVYAPPPAAPALPNIEQAQAQQQARIQWGSQVGLINGREFHRLQQTQGYIEQQRQWAYADGWFTYDEHVGLLNLLNGAGEQIERSLLDWQRVNTQYYPMPPVFTSWHAPRHQAVNQGYRGHPAQNRHPHAAPVQVAVPDGRPHGHRPPAPVLTAAQVPVHPVHRPPMQTVIVPVAQPSVVQPSRRGHREVTEQDRGHDRGQDRSPVRSH